MLEKFFYDLMLEVVSLCDKDKSTYPPQPPTHTHTHTHTHPHTHPHTHTHSEGQSSWLPRGIVN